MDSQGMLAPPGAIPCKVCCKGLDADGNRPAERYAGTFTGLCYACQNGQAYDTGKRTESGAEVWSHPPHCPSWRRDREEYYYFPDCAARRCAKGRQWVSRPGGQGGSYTINCEVCYRRHLEHPATIEAARLWKAQHAARLDWRIRCNAEYLRRGGNEETLDNALAAQVLGEAPPEPTGEALAIFPDGWAKRPGQRKARK